MNPKKANSLKVNIAKEVGVHEEVVDAFIEFYYEKLRYSLSNLVYPKVYVNNLGTFTIRKSVLEKNIKKQKDILGNLKKLTYNGYEKSVSVQDKIKLYEKALADVNKLQQNKLDFKKNKNGSK